MELSTKIPYHAKNYDLYVVLGAPDSTEVWQWENWNKITKELEPFVSIGRGKTAIRTTQFVKDGRKTVSFGQIGWNEKGHQKWTHGSPTTIETSKTWTFLQMELWSPAWTICDREHCLPDIFVAFRNEAFWPRKIPLKFNQTIIFAVSTALGDDVLSNAHKWILQLSADLHSPLAAHQKRTWGKAFGNLGGFSNSIQDMITTGLFKVGDHRNRPVDLQTFEESWTPIFPAP